MTEHSLTRIGEDRRQGDRRKAQLPFEGPDRRTGSDRRTGADRRASIRVAGDGVEG